MKNTKAGFGPIAIIIIIALIAAAGGGTYYAKKQAKVKAEAEMNANGGYENRGNATSTANANINAGMSTSTATGTIKSLLSLGGNMKCDVQSTNAQGSAQGTLYVSGTSMRGDFTMKGKTTVTGSMIKQGDTIYVWSGANGAKLAVSEVTKANSSAGAQANVNMNDNVSYKCDTWTPDATKFALPSTVKFIDLQAMMKGAVKL